MRLFYIDPSRSNEETEAQSREGASPKSHSKFLAAPHQPRSKIISSKNVSGQILLRVYEGVTIKRSPLSPFSLLPVAVRGRVLPVWIDVLATGKEDYSL